MWNQLGCCYCCSSQTGHHHLISNPPFENGVNFTTLSKAPTPLFPPYCFFPQPTMVVQSTKPGQLLHILHHPPHQENMHQQGVQNFFKYEDETLKQFGVESVQNIFGVQQEPFEEYQQSTQQYFPSTITTQNIISEHQHEQQEHSLLIMNSNSQNVQKINAINDPIEPISKKVNIDLSNEKVMESVQIDHVQNNQYNNQKLEEDILVPRQNSPPSQTIPLANQMISLSPAPLYLDELEISENTLLSHQTIQYQPMPIQVLPQIFHPGVIQNNEMIFQSCHSKEILNNEQYSVQNNNNGYGNTTSGMRPFNKSQSLSNSILNKRKHLWLPPKRVLTSGGSLPVEYCVSFPENINQSSSRSDGNNISKRRTKKSLIGIKRASFSADNLIINQNLAINQEMYRRTNEENIKLPPCEPLLEQRQVLQHDLSTEDCSIEKLQSSDKKQKLKSHKSSKIIQVVKNNKIEGNTRNDKIHKMKNKEKSTKGKKSKMVGFTKNYYSKSNSTERNKVSQQQQQQHRRMYNNNNSPRQLVLPSLTSQSASNYSTTSYTNEKYKLCWKESQGLQVCGCNLTIRPSYSDQMGLLPTVDTEHDIAYSSKGPGQDLTKKVLKLREHNRLPMLSPISARKHCLTATTSTNPRPQQKYITIKNRSVAAFLKSTDSINHDYGYCSSENSNLNSRILRRNSKTRANFCDSRAPSFDSKPIINPIKFKRFQDKIRRLSTPPNTHNSTLKNAYYIYPECES